jgi:hypothetical protein
MKKRLFASALFAVVAAFAGAAQPAPTNPPTLETNVTPDLRLSGVASFPTRKWAFFELTEPRQPTRYHRLGEGQRVGNFEVVSIDVQAAVVKVRINGAEKVLSLAASGLKEAQARKAEREFVAEHTRYHEWREKLEDQRRAREREEAERLLKQQTTK